MQRTTRISCGALLALIAGCSSSVDTLTCDAGTFLKEGACVPVSGLDAGSSDGAAITDAGGNADAANNADASAPDSGIAAAILSRTMIDFGGVVTSSSATLQVTLQNPSASAVTVTLGALSGANAADFAVHASSTTTPTTITLVAGAQAQLSIRFAPTVTGARAASYALQLCAGGCDASLALSGTGLLQSLDCQPSAVDFHFVTPMSCRDQTVTCSNVSSQYATLVGFQLSQNTPPSFSVVTPASARAIAPGDAQPIVLRYCPPGLVMETGLLAITTIHPDPSRSIQSISLSGQGGGPNISCAPGPIDLGVAGIGQIIDRTVFCANLGNIPLLIAAAGFGAGPHADLTIRRLAVMNATVTLPLSLPPGPGPMGGLEVHLRYAPQAVETASTSLVIMSNDSDTPRLVIPVSGSAISSAGCSLSSSPASLDFGAVSPGSESALPVTIRNTGTGACAVTVVGAGPPFNLGPIAPVNMIAPGSALDVPVIFAPPMEGSYASTLALQTTDLQHASIVVPLAGVGIKGLLVASPSGIDFGDVPLGCARPVTRTVDVTLAPPGLATVFSATIEAGSAGSFAIATATRSFAITPGGRVSIPISFSPTGLTHDVGRLALQVMGGPTQFVSLSGTGSASATNTISVIAGPSTPVDLLFLVTDTPSMMPERALLASAAAAFIARADALGADYHIGVTSTSNTVDGGTLLMPVISSQSPNRAAQLAQLFGILHGSAPGPQSGLFDAQWAVTANLPMNPGFLRPNATLSVIVVSDQDDASFGMVPDFIAQMNNRPVGIHNNTRISLLGGGLAGCAGPNGTAPPSPIYIQAVQATGGALTSICDASFATDMATLADASFLGGGPRIIQLGSPPAPGSVQVHVNGTLLTARTGTVTHYSIDYRTARVSFAAGFVPGPNDTVQVQYAPLCVAATCGNGHLDPGEQCDDGNAIDTDACPSTCFSAFCGDGFVHGPAEQCDDGNTLTGDGCNATCIIEGCGNGVLEPGEECDNGPANSNTVPNACRTDCRRAHCHDGVVDSGEQCDDGNTNNSDGCVDECRTARCGDGHLHLGAESCDDGNTNNTDVCSNACTWNVPGFTVTRTDNRPLTPTPGGTALVFQPSFDDGTATASIGFPFSFLGTPVTSAIASTNGLLVFEPTDAQQFINAAIPDALTPNAFIAWWWDDLNMQRMGPPMVNTTATTQLIGVAPNRIRVFTFLNVPAYGMGDTLLNVELRLHETTQVIEVHYGALGQATPLPTTFSASLGWESTGGLRGGEILGCSPNCTAANWPTNAILTYTP